MKFKTAFDRGQTTEMPLGSPIAPTYGYRIDKKTGKKILEKTGETNLYEKIQASLEGSKLINIIKKVTISGDMTPLNVKEGQFIDISEFPTNMIELQNVIYKAQGEFEKLDAETRSKFDNSVEKFVSLYGSEEWLNNLGYGKKVEEITEKTTKSEKEESVNE